MIVLDNKIRLRKADMKDIDALYEIKNDIKSASLLGGFSNGYSRKDIENWINYHNNKQDEVIFLIETLKNEKVIGHVGLYNIDFRVRKAEFAILIAGEDNQGKGYGSLCTKFMIDYAFDELNIRKINLSLLSENKRAVSMYNKIGFLQEGILRNDQYKNGKYHDVILMALARSY
jgi:ribosomal-protein-alanine N-acetyltransferase